MKALKPNKVDPLTRTRPEVHAANCHVCNLPDNGRDELEKAYLERYYTQAELAEEFGVSNDSVWKHLRYFKLPERRMEDTKNIYKMIAAKGIQQIEQGLLVRLQQGRGKADILARVDVPVDPKTVVKALERLDKLEGREQEPQKNKRDQELIAQRIEKLIQSTIREMKESGLMIQADTPELERKVAIEELQKYEPELMKLIEG